MQSRDAKTTEQQRLGCQILGSKHACMWQEGAKLLPEGGRAVQIDAVILEHLARRPGRHPRIRSC